MPRALRALREYPARWHSHSVRLSCGSTNAVLSSRGKSAILQVGNVKGHYSYDFVLGGPNGTVPIYDLDGSLYAPGHSLWVGQHNAEYYGENTYLMMDNQAGSSDAMHNNSRLLSVVYDPRDGHATIDWAHEFNGNSAAFGDHDRLPTGNALGCMWPGTIYLDEGAGPTYVWQQTEDAMTVAAPVPEGTKAKQVDVSYPSRTSIRAALKGADEPLFEALWC